MFTLLRNGKPVTGAAEIGDVLRIEVPVGNPVLSSTGKTFLVGGTSGTKNSGFMHTGQGLMVGMNCFIKNPDYVEK